MSKATKILLVATLVLITLGANVTSTESGMADPHWPSFDGQLLPSVEEMRADRGKLYEHTHRLVAAVVILLAWGVAFLATRHRLQRWVRRLAWAAAFVVLLPALLGGLTVLFETPPWTSIVHVALAMFFLSLVTVLTVVSGSKWQRLDELADRLSAEDSFWMRNAAWILVGSVYLQILFGAVLRHAYVGEVPHIVWAFVVFTLVALTASRVFSRHSKLAPLLAPATVLVLLVVVQFFLGLTAFVTRPEGVDDAGSTLHQVIATSHQVAGALMLVFSVVLLARTLRLRAGMRGVAGDTGAQRASTPPSGRVPSGGAPSGEAPTAHPPSGPTLSTPSRAAGFPSALLVGGDA